MIRAVYFDAVGTLIFPRPHADAVYCEVGRRHGSRRNRMSCRRRFSEAFQKQEDLDRARGWITSEQREHQRWRDIVAEVLDDVKDPEGCFAELYQHFANPAAWWCKVGTEEVLAALRGRGCLLGAATNYDHRLHTVVAGLPALHMIDRLIVSAEVGWRKPAPQFFEAIRRQAGVPAAEILYVGDDRANDYDGAKAAGLHAVLLDPTCGNTAGARKNDVIGSLNELVFANAFNPGPV